MPLALPIILTWLYLLTLIMDDQVLMQLLKVISNLFYSFLIQHLLFSIAFTITNCY